MQYRFIDRIRELDAEGAGRVTLVKTFARSEDFFNDTFREPNEVPSSLVLETMAAAGSFLLGVRSRYRALALLIKVGRAAFLRPILAGDRMLVRSQILGAQSGRSGTGAPVQSGDIVQTSADCLVGGARVAEAELLFLCVPVASVVGPQADRLLTRYLDLIGLADARP